MSEYVNDTPNLLFYTHFVDCVMNRLISTIYLEGVEGKEQECLFVGPTFCLFNLRTYDGDANNVMIFSLNILIYYSVLSFN